MRLDNPAFAGVHFWISGNYQFRALRIWSLFWKTTYRPAEMSRFCSAIESRPFSSVLMVGTFRSKSNGFMSFVLSVSFLMSSPVRPNSSSGSHVSRLARSSKLKKTTEILFSRQRPEMISRYLPRHESSEISIARSAVLAGGGG
jgi:hypothetical protein